MMMVRVFLIGFVLSSVGFADIQKANLVIQQYEKNVELWETSMKAAEITGQKPLVKAPNKTKTALKIWNEVAPLLSKEESFPATIWLYEYAPSFLKGALTGSKPDIQINRAIQRYHFKSDKLDQLLLAMATQAGPMELSTIEKVKEQNPNDIQRGVASLALSIALSGMDEASAVKKRLASLREAVKLVPSSHDLGKYNFEKIVGDQLYWITSLSKGKVAPEFTLLDAQGERFTLSNKVDGITALVFVDKGQLAEEKVKTRLLQLQAVAEEIQGQLIVISNGKGTLGKSKVLTDENAEVFEQYRISQTPYVVLMDKMRRLQLRAEPSVFVDLTMRALKNAEE